MKLYQRLLSAAASCGLIALPTFASADDFSTQHDGPRTLFIAPEGGKLLFHFVNDEEASDHERCDDRWLGVQIRELPELVRSQLKLKHGVVADSIFPDSPAERAGIHPRDILLKVNDDKITDPRDLLQALNAAESDKVTLTVLREGKETKIEVTLDQRPPHVRRPLGQGLDSPLFERHQATIDALQKALADREEMNMMFVRPGVVVGLHPFELPEGVEVTIKRSGKEPAEVTVKDGEKTWTVTEDNLDEIPGRYRPHVLAMLRGPHFGLRAPITVHAPHRVGPPLMKGGPKAGPIDEKLDTIIERLDKIDPDSVEQMRKELHDLRQQMETLQERLPRARK